MTLTRCTVADLPGDHRAVPTRTEWINLDHVESVVGYLTWSELAQLLWLELTMTSGAVRYVLSGPVHTADLDRATQHAIDRLTEQSPD